MKINTFVSALIALLLWGMVSSANAAMISPAPGSVLPPQDSVTFKWENTGASRYYLYFSTISGLANLGSYSVYGTSFTKSGLPNDGNPIYIKLWQYLDGKWTNKDFVYITSTGNANAASLITPRPYTTLTSTSTTFEWMNVGSNYNVKVGSSFQGEEYLNLTTTGTSVMVDNLPADGSVVFVWLSSYVNNAWEINYYTFTSPLNGGTSFQPATIFSPKPSSTLGGTSATFQWLDVQADEYHLSIGSIAGGNDIYDASQGKLTSAYVNTLPNDGRILYVRLSSYLDNEKIERDYIYTSYTEVLPEPAEITSPVDGITFGSTSMTFYWSAGVGVSEYRLSIGSNAGGSDLYNGAAITNTMTTVYGLPEDGSAVYATLSSKIDGVWQEISYRYTAYTKPLDVAAKMVRPIGGSTLESTTVTFQWENTGAYNYYLYVGSYLGGTNYYYGNQGTNTSKTITNLPSNGSTVYVRIWTRATSTGGWKYIDYSYTAYTQGSQ